MIFDPETWLKRLASRQWRDYQWGTPGSAFADPETVLTLDEAYKVQLEVARLRCDAGDAVVGYKVGCIGPSVVKRFGMSGPIHARIFRSEIYDSGVKLRHLAFANPAIEGEMGLQVGNDGQIVAAFPVIELHHFVFRGVQKTLVELVANNGISAGAVIPSDLRIRSLKEWESARMLSISVNGRVVDLGPLWGMEAEAVGTIEWLRRDLGRFGVDLAPGDIVLAGTPLGLHPVLPGDHVLVSVDGVDCVACYFT
jgi:2-keto-4-pentenoate hydratase